ncbi:MAG: alpha/beta hydrolase [Beijerinckiaceae bacterium]
MKPVRRDYLKRALHVCCLAATGLLPFAAPANAQVPPDLAEQLRKIGRVIAPPPTAKIYAPLHPKQPYAGVDARRDIKYGPDARHLLDIVTTGPTAGAPKPVLIFVHGGGFVRGDRITIPPFYSNVPSWAAKNGFVGVSMTYRLAPKHKWPSGRDDVASAIAWVQKNIAQYGGDPQRIFLMGHSAGAIHVATYAAMLAEKGEAPIAGAILVSALYEFDDKKAGKADRAYLGDKAATFTAATSLPSLAKRKFPLLLVYGELDPPNFVQQAQHAWQFLCDKGKCPTFVALKDHSHISETYAIGTKDTSLTSEILSFVQSQKK